MLLQSVVAVAEEKQYYTDSGDSFIREGIMFLTPEWSRNIKNIMLSFACKDDKVVILLATDIALGIPVVMHAFLSLEKEKQISDPFMENWHVSADNPNVFVYTGNSLIFTKTFLDWKSVLLRTTTSTGEIIEMGFQIRSERNRNNFNSVILNCSIP
jgi:hypothetical protein